MEADPLTRRINGDAKFMRWNLPSRLSGDLGKIGGGVHRPAQFVEEPQAIAPQFRVAGVNRHIFKKYIDWRPQRGQAFHRIFERSLARDFRPADAPGGERQMTPRIGADALNDTPKLFFGEFLKKRVIAGAVEGAWPIVFFLGAENIGGTAIAGEQIRAVFRIEKTAKRLDAGYDQKEIVLPRQGEHRVDKIISRAALAQIDLETLSEKAH